jgi:hypothetical protein
MEQVVEESAEAFSNLTRHISLRSKKQVKYSKTTAQKEDDEFDPEKDTPPLSAYLTLGSAVIALSSWL